MVIKESKTPARSFNGQHSVQNIETKSVLVISSDPSFNVEVSYILKNSRATVNYCWSLESFVLLPVGNTDLVVMSNDAWSARNIYGKKFRDKIQKIKNIIVFSDDKDLPDEFTFVHVTNDFDEFEDKLMTLLKKSATHGR